MAKILQIRRGTTAQNDSFTGQPGEVTMDTTAKTLRLHDGETLGGFPLARADQISGGNAIYDITTVPDEFWTELLNRFLPNTIIYTDGRPMTFGVGAFVEYIFDIDKPGLYAQPILICQNPDAGYETGDMVFSFGIGNHCAMSPNIFSDHSGVHVRLFTGGATDIWVLHKTNGIKTMVNPDNWRIKFRLYY